MWTKHKQTTMISPPLGKDVLEKGRISKIWLHFETKCQIVSIRKIVKMNIAVNANQLFFWTEKELSLKCIQVDYYCHVTFHWNKIDQWKYNIPPSQTTKNLCLKKVTVLPLWLPKYVFSIVPHLLQECPALLHRATYICIKECHICIKEWLE